MLWTPTQARAHLDGGKSGTSPIDPDTPIRIPLALLLPGMKAILTGIAKRARPARQGPAVVPLGDGRGQVAELVDTEFTSPDDIPDFVRRAMSISPEHG